MFKVTLVDGSGLDVVKILEGLLSEGWTIEHSNSFNVVTGPSSRFVNETRFAFVLTKNVEESDVKK